MDATPPAHLVETFTREAIARACPGCGAPIDLGEYGLLTTPTEVVCRACGNRFLSTELLPA